MKFAQFVGLTEQQVAESRKNYGTNDIPTPKGETFWEKLKEKFTEPLIKILCAALVITGVLAIFGYSDWKEGVGIAISVFIATFVATYSEHKNEESFQELQEKANRIDCMVFRGGALGKRTIQDIVVGDQVLLQAGDRVPADGTLIAGEVELNQSSLNGEIEPFQKTAADPNTPVSESEDVLDPHRCFRGAVVEEGEGVMRVEVVGCSTVHGKLALSLSDDKDQPMPPLQVKLAALADGISKIGYMGAICISVSFMFKQIVLNNHWEWTPIMDYFTHWPVAFHDVLTSVVLAIIIIVVAVPEGLPMMIAVVLSLNMRKLLTVKVLVRRLMGIETAGCLEVLFSDKTGTLTMGVFEPELFLSGSGTSYSRLASCGDQLRGLLTFVLRNCSSAIASRSKDLSSDQVTIVGGNATDRALLRFLGESVLDQTGESTLEGEILFNSVHKFSAVQVRLALEGPNRALATSTDVSSKRGSSPSATGSVTLIKGAPEILLERCTHYYDDDGAQKPFTSQAKLILLDQINKLSAQGTRMIGVGTTSSSTNSLHTFVEKEVNESEFHEVKLTPYSPEITIEMANANPKGKRKVGQHSYCLPPTITLVGIVGVSDRIRPSTKDAVWAAARAGIQVVMVTGDRVETAIAIAKTIGLLQPTDRVEEAVMVSSQLQHMSVAELARLIPTIKVVGRALPSDKCKLVQAARMAGKVVGMTGDGVNDSAGLKHADVSFAMGSGSEVAKEASDVVILDDNFESIVQAVLYGRTIFKSIRKFIVFQSTINLASSVLVFVGPFVGFDFPLTLIQLLWLNLVMDTFAGLAFGGEPALSQYMHEKPVGRDESIVNPKMWSSILCNGLFIAFYSLVFLRSSTIQTWFDRMAPHSTDHLEQIDVHARHEGVEEIRQQGGPVFLTAFFCFFIFLCALNAFNVRTAELDLTANISKNRGFVAIIGLIFCAQIAFVEWGGSVLRTVPLTLDEWIRLIMMASIIIPLDLLRKYLMDKFQFSIPMFRFRLPDSFPSRPETKSPTYSK